MFSDVDFWAAYNSSKATVLMLAWINLQFPRQREGKDVLGGRAEMKEDH